jgi:hypothetical protein
MQRHTNDNPRSTSGSGLYVLVTAAYNEEAFIEQTIRSVLSQLALPLMWVIVSDGSTDRTDEIVQRYAARYSFIRLIRREKDHNRKFASKVYALRLGVASLALDASESQFIGHLDGDIALEPTYFRDLLEKFDDPGLGIAGGWYFEKRGGEYRPARGESSVSVPGALQMFRRKCYEDIGGLLPIEYGGEDWYAEIMARKCGWKVESFPEIRGYHLRAGGTRESLMRYCFHQGFMDFALGTHPIFEICKVIRRIPWNPFVLGATARLVGFFVAHFRGRRMVSPECIAFLRKEQMARLCANPFFFRKDKKS